MAIVNGSLELGYKNTAWFTANPTLVLKEGQIVYLEQTGTYKIGNGSTQLSALSFLGISSETQTLQNVTDLGNFTTNNIETAGITTDYVQLDTTATTTGAVGKLTWNDVDGTANLGLKGGNVTLQIGQEFLARVVNKTATNISLLESNYQAVRITGAIGQRPKVDLALADNDLNSATTLGLVTETIANNAEGFITTSGQVKEINTTGSLQGETWVDGDTLYLSGTVAGMITNIKPSAPIHTVIIGFVEYAHAIHGKIFVKVNNGYELEELHNVSAIAPNNNEVLTYETSSTLWKPKTVVSALGFTPYNATNPDGYISGINSSMVTTALGFTPYNSTNPSGYITGITSGNVTTALGYTPYNATNPSGYITSSALSSYVPYTGATSAVSLGSNNLTIGATGQLIEIKQTANAPTYTQTGATSSVFRLNAGTRSLLFETYGTDQNYFTSYGANFRIRTGDALPIEFYTTNTKRLTILSGGSLLFAEANDIQTGTTTGTKIATATTQKIAFWNATPIVQPANTTSLNGVLETTGLMASGSTSCSIDKPTTISTSATTPLINGVSGNLAFNNAVQTSGAITAFTFTKPNNTTQTASTSISGFVVNGGTRQWNTGNITAQSENVWGATTYSFVGPSTITTAYGNVFNAPIAGTNATITNRYAALFNGAIYSDSTNSSIFDNSAGSNFLRVRRTGGTIEAIIAATGSGAFIGSSTAHSLNIQSAGVVRMSFAGVGNGDCTFADGMKWICGSTIGNTFGSANTQKIAFWNAIPIVQPTTSVTASTFVTNTSGILNDTATFDGYTIGQVVKALRNMGLLA